MSLEPICVYVYINGEVIPCSCANEVFRSDKTQSILLNPTMIMPDIIIAIQSSIRDDHATPIITALWYRCIVYQFNGRIECRAIQIIDEGVWFMFDTFSNITSVIWNLKLMFIIHHHLLKLMT